METSLETSLKTSLKTLRTIITLLVLSVAATGCAKWFKSEKPALSGRVTGTVTYKERIALPPDAKIIVSLEDVSRVGASSIFIAQQTLRASSQVPIAFDLRYIPSAIDLRNRYSVRAVILDNQDELLWTTTESYPVNFKEADQAFNLMLQRVGNPMANHPSYNAMDKTARPAVAAFKCDELEFIARFPSDDKVEILLAGRTIVLPHVISGSGARYSNGSTTFWNKGNEALFEMNGVSYKGCKTDPLPEAPATPATPAAPAKVKGK